MVASRVKLERIKRGLTQQQLADLTNGLVSQPVLSQIELGRRPRQVEATVLAAVLATPVAELFGDDGGC